MWDVLIIFKQEDTVTAMKEQIKRLQDAVAERSLSASCGPSSTPADNNSSDDDCWSTTDSNSPDRNSLYERSVFLNIVFKSAS